MTIRIATATILTLILLGNQIPTAFAQLGPPDVISSPLGRPFTISDSVSQSSNSSIIKFESSKKEPVYCLLDGIVVKASSKDGNNGKDVEIYHPYPGLSTITSNLGSLCVKPGEQISRGQLLGYAE